MAWSKDGSMLAFAGDDGQATLWDARTMTVQATLRGHTCPVSSLSGSPDSRQLARVGWATSHGRASRARCVRVTATSESRVRLSPASSCRLSLSGPDAAGDRRA